MNCRETLERFPDFLEAAGSVPGDVRNGVKDHLERCEACRGTWREMEEVCAAARGLMAGLHEPPPGYFDTFLPRVKARIAASGEGHPALAARPRVASRWLPLAASLLVGFLLGGLAVSLAPRGSAPATTTARSEPPAVVAPVLPGGDPMGLHRDDWIQALAPDVREALQADLLGEMQGQGDEGDTYLGDDPLDLKGNDWLEGLTPAEREALEAELSKEIS